MKPPHITAWSGEAGYVVRPEPLLRGQAALFCAAGKQGDGVPVWGRISEERQRRCVLQRLCQVCGCAFGISGYAVAIPIDGPASLPMRSHEPLVCLGCLPDAFRCPRIRQALADSNLAVVRVAGYAVVAELLGLHPNPVDEIDIVVNEALREANPPEAVGFVEMLISEGAVLSGARLVEIARLGGGR